MSGRGSDSASSRRAVQDSILITNGDRRSTLCLRGTLSRRFRTSSSHRSTPTRVLIAQRGDNKCEITRARVRGTTARRYLRLFNIFTTSCVSHSRPFGSGDGRGARRAVIGTKSFSKRCRGWTEQGGRCKSCQRDWSSRRAGSGLTPEGLLERRRGDILCAYTM
ncbi:hypothetical protein EVAR_89212_1 [Eumeta japonica]|uniref:Uncharacterized protein n=1 Tax=Eumeta variegata TaxID=151549 RepID=A0A4C2A6X0_EUMVA|nr:hypothetical protein EVAR_89212_1 [Eumeta japonica]